MTDNVRDQIKQYVDEIDKFRNLFDNSTNYNEKKSYIDAIRELHGKTKTLVLKHEIQHINDVINQDFKTISENNSLINYIEGWIRKCEKKMRGVTEDEDQIFIPQDTYNLRQNRTGEYELSLNIPPTETGKVPVKKVYRFHDDATTDANMDKLQLINTATTDEALSIIGADKGLKMNGGHGALGFVGKRSKSHGVHNAGHNDDLSSQIGGVGTEEGNNIVDEYFAKLKALMEPQDPTLSEQVNGVDTDEGNNLIEEFDEELKSMNSSDLDVTKPTIVRYWADWCGPSMQAKPEWDKFKSGSNVPGLQIVDLNVESGGGFKTDLAIKVGVTGFPSIRLFANGKIYKCDKRDANGIELFCKTHITK